MIKKRSMLVSILLFTLITLTVDFLAFSKIGASSPNEFLVEIELPYGEKASSDIVIDVWSSERNNPSNIISNTITI